MCGWGKRTICFGRYDTRSDFDPASGPPGSGRALNKYGLEAKEALDRGLASAPDDVWLAHLKVHFNEMGYEMSLMDS